MKVLTVDQMRQADQDCIRGGTPAATLMENAGKAVAEEVRKILYGVEKKRILVLVGPGNNGGDGLVAARYLHDWGAKVIVYLCAQRSPDDPNLRLVQERKISCIDVTQPGGTGSLEKELKSADAVIDALFGTGKSRPLSGVFTEVLEKVNEEKKERPALRVIALDLPSGLNSDTGAVEPACPYADNTITLAFPKVGLFNFPGAERVGILTVVDIGIPSHFVDYVTVELLTDEWARAVLPARPIGANKGSFGKVLVAAGSINYIGAAYLACSGAVRVGAGLVTLATAASLQPILASKLAEVTYFPLPENHPGSVSLTAAGLLRKQCAGYNALLMGCGLGQDTSAVRFVKGVLRKTCVALPSLVLDADALNILSKTPRWWQQVADNAILTPHPGEMSRLTGVSIDEVQSDRIGVAGKSAASWNKTVVLKGAFTVVAEPEGRVRISPFANPGLASAGTGDALSGVIAGLLAQGLSLFDAAALGVYLHGKVGERVKDRLGDTGMIASDLLPELPLVIKKLKDTTR